MDSIALEKHGRFEEIIEVKRGLAKDFILGKPSSLISMRLLNEYYYKDEKTDDTVYHRLFYSLSNELRTAATGKKIKAEVDDRFKIAKGRPAPLLQLPDLENKITSLYNRGEYTLISFWATWCLPCRKEHPDLKALNQKYSGKGLRIVSVSIDTNKWLWQQTIKNDHLTWTQLIDQQGWAGAVAKVYSIKAIPMNFLLDDNGIILGKNLSVEDIVKCLRILKCSGER
jgi:thiol-disulfide isomerase/thioredoxin